MLNFKIISKVLGTLLMLLVLLLLVCLATGLFYGEREWMAFAIPAAVSFVLALMLKYFGRHAENKMSRRDGYFIVSASWLVFSIIGTLPFLLGTDITRLSCAFFESMSGFTTTGASVYTDIDHLPHSILFWRSLSHWFGGMGIVFFTIAVLPQMGVGDLKLFSAEATGLKTGKVHPRISTTARWIWGLYVVMTIACSVALILAGMSPFDAINHSMATISTGGFSTHQDSVAYFQSPLIEYIEIIFMAASGINFTLLYLLVIKRRFREVWRDAEIRFYAGVLLFFTIYCAVCLYVVDGFGIEHSLRAAAFQVTSLGTTTGFTTKDFQEWHACTWVPLLFVSLMGACAGSTSGGMKCVRILTSWKMMADEFRQMLHPRAVIPVRLGYQTLGSSITQTIFAYFVAMFLLLSVAMVAMMCMGIPMLDSISLGVASFSNAGPSIGWYVGPLDSWDKLPDGVLWICSFLMLAGRLEIFSLLLPFVPAFWKER